MVFNEDPMLQYVSTGGLSGQMPKIATTNYPIGLRTFMRNSWEDDALAMAFINTDYNAGSHGHHDHLSIAMFAYGRYLLTDQAYGAALTGNTAEFMGSAPQHNLVTVNNSDHNDIHDTNEIAFESNELYDFTEYGGYYTQNVKQQRNVLFLKKQKFWIVGDYANPDDQNKVNSYEQNWHMLPGAGIHYDEETFEVRSNYGDYNVNVVPVETDGMSAYYEDTVFAPASGTFEDTQKVVLKKETAGNAMFTTIILPRSENEDFDVEAKNINTGLDANAFVAKITNLFSGEVNVYYYYHLNDPEQKQTVNIGQFTTDAATMLVETDLDGNITSTFLMDATFLEDNKLEEKVLFKSNSVIESIVYEKQGQIFDVYSSTLTDEKLDEITIYAPGQLNIRIKGEYADGKKSGNYLYFGDTPIIEGTQDDNSEDNTTSKPDREHASTSGGGGGGGASAVLPKPPVTEVTPPTPPETVAPAVPYEVEKEVEGHWGKEQITKLYKDGIITGDADGLRLKDSISRVEFTALVIRALDVEEKEYNGNFADVSADFWGAGYIATAYEMGLVNGADGMFRPNDTITREEMCKIIASAIKEDITDTELAFTDNDIISSWAVDSVKKAYSLGIVKGMDNGEFAPKSNALREQAFVIIARLIEKLK